MERCKKITDLFGAYIYGDLSPDEMRRIRTHVEQCEECARDLEARTRVVEMVPRDVPSLSDEDRQRIMWSVKGAIKAKQEPKRSCIFSSAYVRGFAVAAIVIAAFAGGTLLGSKSNPPKVIVKRVPVKQQQTVAEQPKKRPVQHSIPVVVAPTLPEPQAIVTDPFRRDLLPETWRGGIKPREPKSLDAILTPPDNMTAEDMFAPLAPVPDILIQPGDSQDIEPKPAVPNNSPLD
jgi:hypothetical protein